MITTIFTKPNGDRIVFDEMVAGVMVAHVEKADGRKFARRYLENILSRGYWEPVPGVLAKEWDESLHPRDERGRFGDGGGVNVVGSEKMMEKIWSPVLAKADKLILERHNDIKNLAERGDLRGTANTFVKEATAHSLAEKLSDVDVRELADASGFSRDWDVQQALTPAGNHDVEYRSEDFKVIYLENGTIFAIDAVEVGDLTYRGTYNKDDVLEQLAKEPIGALQGTPEAEQMVREAACSNLVSMWASTSNNNSPEPLAMQEVAARDFGIANHAPWDMTPFVQEKVDSIVEQHGDIYALFLRAQYDGTQEFLKANGVDSVTVYRGMSELSEDVVAQVQSDSNQNIQMRPLSGWTSSEETARQFAWSSNNQSNENGVIMQAVIPAEQILSMPGTGFGCLHEQEFVVLGGEKTVTALTVDDYIEASKAGKDPWSK